ncbi:MAG: hypothetical protein ACKOWW_03575, partial [Flavobacteriales bacterium]
MSSSKNSIGTIVIISCAVILLIVGLLYSLMGGAKSDVVTKEQAEADSLRTVLRETQQKLMEEQRKKEAVDVTPKLTLEQQQAKLEHELWLKESQHPLDYLTIDYNHTYRWFAGKEEYSGHIYNAAKYATFMNFDIRVTFLSETKTALETKVFKILKYCDPAGSAPFTIQAEAPSAYKYHRV